MQKQFLKNFIFIISAMIILSNSVIALTIPENITSHWPLNEGSGTIAEDSSPNSNNGTINGAAWVLGHNGNALQFDGINDYVGVTDNPSFTMTDFTVSYWVKPDSFNPSDQSEVVSKWSRGNRQFLLGFEKDGDYYFAIGESSCNRNRAVVEFQNTAPPLSQWTHVAWVQDGTTGQITLYENDIEKNFFTYTADVCTDTSVKLRIGARGDNQEYFDGAVDEILIWNRTLTASEVSDLYNLQQ